MLSTLIKNYSLYLMEAAGLAFFMISACFFGGLLWSDHSPLNYRIASNNIKFGIMGVMMGFTALGIFYSPFTNKSGAQINPAVTLTFFRLGRMKTWDTIFYILFQFIGGTLAVYIMKTLMGNLLTDPRVNYIVTIPAKYGIVTATLMEFSTAFVMMTMVLITSAHQVLRNYTRIIAACLVCVYVMIAGPVSGFGMNPARTFASALPSNTWTGIWMYLTIPVAGMLSAAELFLLFQIRLQTLKCFYIPDSPK